MGKPMALTGGSYTARSIIANCQRCWNLYPEKNPEDSPFPVTYYPTPGKVLLWTPPVPGPARCAYRASNGAFYYVVGQNVYLGTGAWTFTLLGTLQGTATTPVYIQDNGIDAVLVDGSPNGYIWDLATNTFNPISDASWQGATRVDTVDTFMLFNVPGTQQWYSSLSNEVTPFDSLYVASKSVYPDPIATIIVMHREIWLIGTQTTEVWYDAGNSGFPFAIIPGVFIEHGCIAPYSIQKHDLELFWLSLDKDGRAVVLMGAKYAVSRVSTSAIEFEFSKYPTVSDAVGMMYLQQGHVFYVLRFPSADKTWVFDRSQGLWHERGWIDLSGQEHMDRANVMAFAYNTNLAGDWENGNLYALDTNAFTDNGRAITRIRSWPHAVAGGTRVEYLQFLADMEVGNDSGTDYQVWPEWVRVTQNGAIRTTTRGLQRTTEQATAAGEPITIGPQVMLRWSDTRGASWGNGIYQELGATGQYYTQPQWQRLGLARDRVFELSWSAPVKTALNGAYVDVLPLAT